MRKRSVLVSVAVFAGVICVAAVEYSSQDNRPAEFDTAIWLRGDHAPFSSSAPRLLMADGLITSGVLVGKTRVDILSMLGPPTPTDKFKDYDLVYWLGAQRGYFEIDSEWLVVRFGTTGKAQEVRIVGD